ALGEAVNVFTKLTIGDGLVSQVPAFLTSLAAGLIVTRSSSETDLGRDVVGQLLGRRDVLAVAAVFLTLLAFTALPKVPLLTRAGALGGGAFLLGRAPGDNSGEPADADDLPAHGPAAAPPGSAPASPEPPSERVEDLLHVDPLELEIGYRLITLAEPTRGGGLLDRLRTIRHRVARDLRLIVPPVRIPDEIRLGPPQERGK